MHVQLNRDKLKWPRLIQGRSQQVGGSAREDVRHLWPEAMLLASKRTRVRSSNGKKSTRKSCSPGMVSTAATSADGWLTGHRPASNPPSWFEVRAPQRQIPVTDRPNLGLGEREAIVLAQELRADILLIDERDGRRAARSRALAVVGTLGVLEKAAAGGLIALPGALARLQATSFYAPLALFEEALARDAARKRPDATGLRGEITTHWYDLGYVFTDLATEHHPYTLSKQGMAVWGALTITGPWVYYAIRRNVDLSETTTIGS